VRVLTEYETDLVAGGWGSSGFFYEDIIINGYYLFFSWQELLWMSEPVPGEGGGGGGEAQAVQEPHETPCVETTLQSGISTTDANRAALAASNKIAEQDDETYEYSSIIWTLNGEVGFTTPYTDHRTDRVNWAGGIDGVPDDAVIVGIVHNHPDDPYVDDRIPSGAGAEDGVDWDRYNTLVNWNRDHDTAHDLPRGISVDRNMLLYVYSNQDSKTHVYDNTDKGQTNASCSLQ
jgi:hypothetical protein